MSTANLVEQRLGNLAPTANGASRRKIPKRQRRFEPEGATILSLGRKSWVCGSPKIFRSPFKGGIGRQCRPRRDSGPLDVPSTQRFRAGLELGTDRADTLQIRPGTCFTPGQFKKALFLTLAAVRLVAKVNVVH
jgi:hypothetical protein